MCDFRAYRSRQFAVVQEILKDPTKIKVVAYMYLMCASGAGKYHDKDPENVASRIIKVITISTSVELKKKLTVY